MVNGNQGKKSIDQAHAAMEPGKINLHVKTSHEMTGHTGEHLLKPTANYMKLKLIGKLPPCEVCAKAKDQTKKCTKEENEETTNQTWIQGIH